MYKKLLSLVLAFLMVLSILPVSADAAAAGTMMSNALEITFGRSYSKSWTRDTDHLNHYTTFTLTERGILTVKADKPFDDEGEYSRLEITFFDDEGEPIMGSECYDTVDSAKSFYTIRCCLDAGTYYMTLKPHFSVISGIITTVYNIDFKAEPYCEIESNGDASEATAMEIGQMYTGYYGSEGSDYEKHDYYKFQAEKGHTYRIRVDNFGDMEETSAILTLVEKDDDSSINYTMRKKIDDDGLHYYDFKAQASGTHYLYFWNWIGAQFEYGLQVIDLTAPSEPAPHEHTYTTMVIAPTCTEKGYTTYTCACGESYTSNYVAAKGHSYSGGICTRCGEDDPNYVPPTDPTEPETINISRLAGGHRYETAFLAANQMKVNLGIDKFDTVVVASGTDFADALSGSYLAAVKDAPILLACNVEWVNNLVKDYISDNLNPGGTVYILGGESAVPASFKNGLEHFSVNRLAGANRFDTNLLVLKEAGVNGKDVLVCTGLSFADSLSASAAEMPILLVWNNLTNGQKDFLNSLSGSKLYVIGGESAVSKGMEKQLSAYGKVERVAGGNRFETSVAIAQKFFGTPKSTVLAYAWNFPDGLCGGPLAAAMDAPLILTMEKYESQAAGYISSKGIQDAVVLGGNSLIPDTSLAVLFG